MGAYDGDLVRPLGFVTLYFAYAEGQLDEVLEALMKASGSRGPDVQSFGTKVGAALQLVATVGMEKLPEMATVLQEVRPIVAARNELVHGQLSNAGQLGGRLVSRAGTRTISAEEIERLAESVWSWKERLWVAYQRELLPLVAQQFGGERPDR